MLKIAIIEDEKISRLGIKSLLTTQKIKIIGEAENGIDGVNIVLDKNPDIVFLDLYLPDITGIEVYKRIQHFTPKAKVIFLTGCTHIATLNQILKVEPDGLITKNSSYHIVSALEYIVNGMKYIQPDIAYELIKYAAGKHTLDILSSREYEVLELYSQGLTQKQIAINLCLSAKTIANIKSLAIKKIGIDSISEFRTLAMNRNPDPNILH